MRIHCFRNENEYMLSFFCVVFYVPQNQDLAKRKEIVAA